MNMIAEGSLPIPVSMIPLVGGLREWDSEFYLAT
jgi:hypothetical protein